MDFLLEAYYVMRLRKYPFAPPPFHHLFTVCTAFNDNLLSIPNRSEYNSRANQEADDAAFKETLQLPDLDLDKIRRWVNKKREAGKLACTMTFADLATAKEYRDRFFGLLPDTYILSISYHEADVAELLQDIKANPIDYSMGKCEQIAEALLAMSNEKGKVIGHDIIGPELGCLFVDSFLVHRLGGDIYERFGIKLNSYGLLNDETKVEAIMIYMHDPGSLVEQHEWSWVQVKLFE
jgi:hypothetical protein